MAEKFLILRDITLILAISLPILYAFKKMGISPIVGFLVTGLVIGPSGFGFISQNDQIELMAELGIIVLMFTIGLEFSIAELLKMKKFILLFGSLQAGITILIGTGLMLVFRFPPQQSFFFAMLVSLSSTAIIMKLLSDKSMLDTPHGKISVGILLFQDMAVIPMLIILPLLSGKADLSVQAIAVKIGTAIGVVLSIIALSKYIVPRLLYQISLLRVREVFTATIIVLILGTAYLTHLIGISFSIGAFIAGFIIAESEFSHQITAEILPFRDIFNSLFFVSAGLLLSLQNLYPIFPLVIGICAAVVLLKSLITFGIVRLGGFPFRTALITAVALAQVGEFSFVLAKEGMTIGIIQSGEYNIFLFVAIVTMMLAPFMIERSLKAADRIDLSAKGDDKKSSPLQGHVIIAGFGLNGKNLAKVLKETGIPYCVVELNPMTVRTASAHGEHILFGDITKRNILLKAGAEKAKVMVFALSDSHSTRAGLHLVKNINPAIKTIIRARYVNEVEKYLAYRADIVIPEEFETSLQIFSRVLNEYHIPMNVILRQINLIRQDSYQLLRSDTMTLAPEQLMDIITKSVTESFYVGMHSGAAGKNLRELNIGAATGAKILAVVRQNTSITSPTGSDVILAGDVVVLTGTHLAVDQAIQLLQ
jgi:CPA2 family monovalent cation:H+ antiporter-2